jgi:subtilisin
MAEETTKTPGAAAPTATRVLEQGKRQFIITSRRGSQALGAGLRPMSAGAVRGLVGQIPGLEVVRVLRPRGGVSALSVSADEATEVYVARIDPARAELIKQTIPPQLIMEEDATLDCGAPATLHCPAPSRLASWSFTGSLETRQMRFRVVGEGDRPLANVGVSLAGEGFPQEGRTDKRGDVTLPLMVLPGRRARSAFVSAPSNYWDQYLAEPELSDGDVNVVRLRAISETIAGFPEQFRYGWGQIQMGLHRIPETLTAKGVKIAIIDSGADNSHPLLRHIRLGLDLSNNADPQGWAQDVIGRGSHCAGIIAAKDDSRKMLRGFAPEAEIHILKIFPGGQFSSVIEALDYCLEREVDVVNLGVSSAQRSQAIEQKLEEAALHGLACIVGAGDSGGPVQYPASSPYALAVAAVGRLNEYADKTWDATTVVPSLVAADGIFWPNFSCYGPEVAVCAPGVAVISTVPGGFEPQSGTSIAAPHVTGLAALLLAHHAAFQGPLRARNQQRVVGLFNMIRLMCVPYGFGPARAGAGLPRLHGLEQVLQPSLHQNGGGVAASTGNIQAAATSAAPSVAPGPVFGQPIGGLAGPMMLAVPPAFAVPALTPPAASAVFGGAVGMVDPFYVHAPRAAAPPWSLQALLDSLRWQYGGV